MAQDVLIRVAQLTTRFGTQTVIDGISFEVKRGEIIGLVGGSGSGKTVLLRSMVGLLCPTSGSVEILGVHIEGASAAQLRDVGRRCGMLFQHGALFSGLTLCENVEFQMRQFLQADAHTLRDVAGAKLALVGLEPRDAARLPSELSGGMTKRAALARALALEPDILFLDEPTSGLDPIRAAEIDALILTLHALLGLTVFMVTHDLRSLRAICTRILALHEGKIVCDGTFDEMRQSSHPWVRAYFNSEHHARQDSV
jgi:phospholipid/cholesterol/gamma-HCH transport system ATP-binding protein